MRRIGAIVSGRAAGGLATSSAVGLLAARFQSSGPKLARLFSMEVNRIKMEYRQAPSTETQERALAALAETPLQQLQNLDAKCVLHTLEALVELKAPEENRTLRQGAEWVAANAGAMGAASAVAAVDAIAKINSGMALDLWANMAPQITESWPADAASVSSATAAAALRVLRLAGHVNGPLARQCVDALQAHSANSKPSDLVSVADVLCAVPSLFNLFHELLRRLPAAEGLSVSDAATVLSLVVRSHLPVAEREALALQVLPLVEERSGALAPADLPALMDAIPLLEEKGTAGDIRRRVQALADGVPLKQLRQSEALAIARRCGEHVPGAVLEVVEALAARTRKVADLPASDLHELLRVLAAVPALQQAFRDVADRLLDELSSTAAGDAVCSAQRLAAFMTPSLTETHGKELHLIVLRHYEGWKLGDLIAFLLEAAGCHTQASRRILRDVATRLAQHVHTASMDELAELSCAYGIAGVRNDILCGAVAERCPQLVNPSSYHLSSILGFLATVDYRNTKAFLDAEFLVRGVALTAAPAHVANLIASYAKMLVWNYKIFHDLCSRAAVVAEFFTPSQVAVILASLERVDVHMESLTTPLLARIRDFAATVTPREAVRLLVVISRYGMTDAALFGVLAGVATSAPLSTAELGELLMSFSRAGLQTHPIFEQQLLAVLAVAPTAPPLVIADFATSYAAAGIRHEELFSILADRTLLLKDDCPAVVIGAILAAFATIGIRNDKLFIEMIGRVRHVPTYGTPQDIVNVVHAYSTVRIWHNRLFMRLADRAIQLRGEFRGPLIARLLASFARVEMKYEKLFTEFSPRIQGCVLTLSPDDLISILQSYCAVTTFDTGVFDVVGGRLAKLADTLSPAQRTAILEVYAKSGITHAELATALSGLPPPAESSAAS